MAEFPRSLIEFQRRFPDEGACAAYLAQVRWPGRFQVLAGSPTVILDGAHNPGGARALAASLRAYFPGRSVAFVLGISADKDLAGILSPLLPLAERVVFTAANSPRAADPESLRELARHLGPLPGERLAVAARPADALARLRRESPDALVCAAGSLFLLGELLSDRPETLDMLCGIDAG